MTSVKINKTPTQVVVNSPYNSLFVREAKRLAGKFSDGAWAFDIRDADRIAKLCRDVYGSDGVTSVTCTIRVAMPGGASSRDRGSIDIHGFTLAKASGRDSGANPMPGVILLEGGFGSGGSTQYWKTTARPGTVVLLRDFPRHAAEKYVQEPPTGMAIAIEDERPPIDVAALTEEKGRLLTRLAEIEELLSSATQTIEHAEPDEATY